MNRTLALFVLLLTVLPIPPSVTLGGRAEAQTAKDPQNQTVYITRTGKKYHRDGCEYLRQGKIPIALKDAKAKGYTPCKVCNPPK